MKPMLNNFYLRPLAAMALALVWGAAPVMAQRADGTKDPDCAVEAWSNASAQPKIVDINFTDTTWPCTWPESEATAVSCPEYDADKDGGGYVNAKLTFKAGANKDVDYPIVFHSCMFANKNAGGGHAATTAAFGRIYLKGENPSNVSYQGTSIKNNWTHTGHKTMLEDNVTKDDKGYPNYGEAGFVQMCRTKSGGSNKKEWLGWFEIDHIPYVERMQWSWSSTSQGRGIKCDIKVGNGDWEPLVWMCSDKHKNGYSIFADQGYFMENVIDKSDVSLRWRVWDGERAENPTQYIDKDGRNDIAQETADLTWYQAPRVHKIQIFGKDLTAADAENAANNCVNDPGALTDMSQFGGGGADDEAAPDANAPVVFYVVDPAGNGDFTAIQPAIDAVKDGERGIIYIRKGTYKGQVFAGTKDSHNKFISLIGEDRDAVVLQNDTYMSSGTDVTFDQTAALLVYCDRFHAENLTLKNPGRSVYPEAGQALALFTRGDAHTFKNCLITGYQDTYKANSGGRGYFQNCTIEGAVDFIYDSGTEWFDGCVINSVASGYVTAPGKADNTLTKTLYPSLSQQKANLGLFFRNCKLTSNNVGAGTVYLGRTWDNNGGAIFLNCTLGNHIKAEGWSGMGDTNTGTCTNAEYQSVDASGDPVSVSGRAAWSFQATAEEVKDYFNPEFVFKNANKNVGFNYAAITAGAPAPANFIVTGAEFTWDAQNPAPGYILYRDGEFNKILTEPRFAMRDDGHYTVASVSRQGVVSQAVPVREDVRLLAFPTADGFGKFASGGRGGRVVTVTNLEDDATGGIEGSLRWALKQYPNEPLTVVFNVSGWIILKEILRVNRTAGLTIAGQTAPGEGITLYPRGLSINGAKNVIIRNIRVRTGSKAFDGSDLIADASIVDQAFCAENAENVIVDHCTFGWSAEEILNNQTSHYQTYSYCLLHEGLYDAGHHKGKARSFGAQWGGSQTTMHHNMIAHCYSRAPRFQGARDTDYMVYDEYVNNVLYNWGKQNSCYGGENNQTGRFSSHEINFVNNYYRQGPATKQGVKNLYFVGATAGAALSTWYLAGNYMDGSPSVTSNNKSGFYVDGDATKATLADNFIEPKSFFINYEFDWATYTMKDKLETAENAYETVLAKVGCVTRDAIEERVLRECKDGTATYTGTIWTGGVYGIIDDPADLTGEMQKEANGFYTCKVAKPSEARIATYDTDGDGMPDAWELQNGLDPNNPEDRNLTDENGYTMLEYYINSLMGERTGNALAVRRTAADKTAADGHTYNMLGQRVGKAYKGIAVRNGKKVLVK